MGEKVEKKIKRNEENKQKRHLHYDDGGGLKWKLGGRRSIMN
jgi:hypothetical protein